MSEEDRTQEGTTIGSEVAQAKVTGPVERERVEPLIEGAGKTPKWFFAVAAVFFGWGLWYLSTTVPGVTLAGDLRSPQAPLGPPTGEEIYAARCVSCHQANGQGVTGVFPPLVASEWVTQDPETPIRILLLGIQGEIEVKGNVYNNVMPAFGQTLSNEEIAIVLTYIRNEWGNDASEISEAQVTEMAANLGGRTDPWNGGAELAALRPSGDAAGGANGATTDATPDDTATEEAADQAAGADVAGNDAGDEAAGGADAEGTDTPGRGADASGSAAATPDSP